MFSSKQNLRKLIAIVKVLQVKDDNFRWKFKPLEINIEDIYFSFLSP